MDGPTPLRRPSPWAIAITASLLLHAAWAAWVPTGGPAREGRQRPSPPSVVYDDLRTWRMLLERDPGDARLIRSPTLFALPAPAGFSGSSLDPLIRHVPPRAREAAVAAPPPARVINLAESSLSRPPPPPAASLGIPASGTAPVFQRAKPAARENLRVSWSDAFPGVGARDWPATNAAWRAADAWECEATVRYDERGAVRAVFIEPSPEMPAGRRAALVRLLYGLPIPPAAGERMGRVTIRYSGPAGGATS